MAAKKDTTDSTETISVQQMLSDAKAAMADMIAEAKAQAEQIIEDAKSKARDIAETIPTVNPADHAPTQMQPQKTVRIRLFKDSGKYKDDVTVILNGRCWRIQRGKEVEVPEAVAAILESSQEQDNRTADMIERETASFERASRDRGIV